MATRAADAADASTAPAADTAVVANDQLRHAENAAEDKKNHAAIAAAAGRIGADNPELSTAPHTEMHAGDIAQSKAPEGMQILAVQHPAEGIAAASPATPAGSSPEAAVAAIPLGGLAVEIAARAQAGRNRFEIRLDPPELGRIDVRLDIDRGGHVTSRLTVDRVETLDALRRDAGDLQKALQDAGFKTADNGMQFTLRDHSFTGRDQSLPTTATARVVVPAPELVVSDTMPAGYGRLLRPGGGIDIRV
jgi:flagellar hook-length control protein FliK